MSKRKYNVEIISVNENGQVVDSNCIDLAFFNYGTADLLINDALRVPAPAVVGQFNFISIGGNEDEIDATKYKVRFDAPPGPPPPTKIATIVRRVYQS